MRYFTKTFQSFAIATTLALSSQMSFATAPTEQSVDQLINLSKLDQVFKESLISLEPFFNEQSTLIIQNVVQSQDLNAVQQKAAQELSANMLRFTENSLKSPKVKEKIREVIKNTYTEEELKAYNTFLNTPEGQSINLKSAKVSIELQSFMENLVQTSTDTAEFEKVIEKILTPLIEK